MESTGNPQYHAPCLPDRSVAGEVGCSSTHLPPSHNPWHSSTSSPPPGVQSLSRSSPSWAHLHSCTPCCQSSTGVRAEHILQPAPGWLLVPTRCLAGNGISHGERRGCRLLAPSQSLHSLRIPVQETRGKKAKQNKNQLKSKEKLGLGSGRIIVLYILVWCG